MAMALHHRPSVRILLAGGMLSFMGLQSVLADTVTRLVQDAFVCGITSDTDTGEPTLSGKVHRIEKWGVSVWLPDRWEPLQVVADRQAESRSPDKTVVVRVTMQPLGQMTLDEVVTTYENAYFGQNQAVGDCQTQLVERYRVSTADQFAVGMYRSMIPLRYWRSSYVIFAIVDSRVFVLEVAANWKEKSLPSAQTIDRILSRFSVR